MIFAEVRLGFKTEFFVLKQDRVCSIIQEMIIDKKTLEHLAALSRIDIDPKKEEKLLGVSASIPTSKRKLAIPRSGSCLLGFFIAT